MVSVKDIINQVDKKVALINSLLPLNPNDEQKLDKKFRLEFNYNSNHIEGNTLTYGETELLLFFEKTNGGHDFREYQEMLAHDVALKIIKEETADDQRPLTEHFIRSLNKCILVAPYWKEAITSEGQATQKEIIPGQYKTSPNSVRLSSGEIFNYTSPDDTPIEMQKLVAWYNENSKKEPPLVLASLLHYQFVRIHPFDDGNGRVARLLMNYVFLKNELPMVVIKSNEKNKYLSALNRADVGEIDAFVIYIGEQLLWSLDLTLRAAEGKDIEEPDDLDKKIAVLSKKINQQVTPKKKSVGILQSTLETSIIPLLDKLIENLKKFEVFYDKIDYRFIINDKADYGDDFNQFKDSILLTAKITDLFRLSVQFSLNGFKPDMASGFMSNGNIVVFFEDYRYGIRVGGHKGFEEYWSYNHDLTGKDRSSILAYTSNPLFEEIERKISQVNQKKI